MAPPREPQPAGSSLKQRIKQKLLKTKYTALQHEGYEAAAALRRVSSNDIVLDAASPAPSSAPTLNTVDLGSAAGSSRAASPAEPHLQLVGLEPGDDASAALLGAGRGAAGRPRGAFAGCLPFGKPKAAPNEGLPTAYNNRQSILSRLSRAAKKPALGTSSPLPGTKAATPKAKRIAHPAHAAAWRQNAAQLRELLSKPGADANKRDRNSLTVLHYAAWQGSVDCVLVALDAGADVNRADAEGMLPIHFAAMFDRLDVAALLLDRGSQLQPATAKGRLYVGWPTTPLILAAKLGHRNMVALLMDRGAGVAGVSKAARSALHEAAWGGHAHVVAELLLRGAEQDLALAKSGHTALHLAALRGDHRVLEMLLSGGAAVDAHAKDGRTPLHLACEKGHVDAAAALLDAGADVAARDAAGLTPLHLAVDNNQLMLAKLLLDRCAPTDATSSSGALPLNYAHAPDFYKLLRAVRWYGAASVPNGDNPSSTSWADLRAALAAAAPAAPAPPPQDAVEEGLDTAQHAAPVAVPAAPCQSGRSSPAAPCQSGRSSPAPASDRKPFPATSWLRSLHLPHNRRAAQAAAAIAASGPTSAALLGAQSSQAPEHRGELPGAADAAAGLARAASHGSISLKGSSRGGSSPSSRSASPAAAADSDASSGVARSAAAAVAAAAVQAVVVRAASKPRAAASVGSEITPAAGPASSAELDARSEGSSAASAAAGAGQGTLLSELLEVEGDDVPLHKAVRGSLGDQDRRPVPASTGAASDGAASFSSDDHLPWRATSSAAKPAAAPRLHAAAPGGTPSVASAGKAAAASSPAVGPLTAAKPGSASKRTKAASVFKPWRG